MSYTLWWLIILVLLVVVEVMTLGLTTIWFAGGALVALILSAVGLPLWVQIPVFLIVSIVLLVFTRPMAAKYFNKDRIRTNAESLVGRQAIVTEDIDNLRSLGKVTVSGMEWTARAVRDEYKIEKGSVVSIRGISGVKLIVEKIEQA